MDSTLLYKGPCGACGSSDACAVYDDGHTHCFSCGAHTPPTAARPTHNTTTKRKPMNLIEGEARAITARKLTEETCRKWGYLVGEDAHGPVQIAVYRDENGEVVGQKVRGKDKRFHVVGKIGNCLYGRHLWDGGGKTIVVTEGEVDALSMSQAQGNRWPVVSVPNGAQGAAKALAANLEWLSSFDRVVLMFDNDQPGREAAQQCAALFPPGKAAIAKLPLKDASDMLVAGRTEELINAMWRAQPWRPDGIVSVADVMERALQPIEKGLPWCFDTLTELTFGRRFGEVYGIGAGTGVGKTDFLTQQIVCDIEAGHVPGVFFLEQDPAETLNRVAGKRVGKTFHVPDGSWTEEERQEAIRGLDGKLWLYDSFGSNEWSAIQTKIRYLAQAEGVRIFYVDHLTALADTANERESLEQTMKELASLANELRVMVTFVSHLSTPEGKPHEEGGRVMIRHFKGSRAIGFWSHYMFGIERDQQAEGEGARLTTIRVLKDRKTGRATGHTFYVEYDHSTGLLRECDPPEDTERPSKDAFGPPDF